MFHDIIIVLVITSSPLWLVPLWAGFADRKARRRKPE